MRLHACDVFSTEQNFALARALEPCNHSERGCLAATRGPQESKELPGRNLEVEVIDSNKAGELFTNAF